MGGTNAANIGVSVNVSSGPAFSGTESLTGTLTGSGDDANSFAVSSGNVVSNSSGGTIEPGQYGLCVTATGSYTNSPQKQCFTVQATGPGGAGWQLAFSDEFGNGMLNWQNQQQPTSITWSSTNGGEAAIVLPAASAVSNVGYTISIAGATNTGSGGAAAVNSNFNVVSFTDSEHFIVAMPAAAGAIGTIGVGSATIGTGPWQEAITTTCSSGTCNGLPIAYVNSGLEGFDPANCTVSGGYLHMLVAEPGSNWTAPDGTSYAYTSCHIQTWTGSAGFAQALGNGEYFDFDGQIVLGSGMHPTFWSQGDNNVWPGGGEIDTAEFGLTSCGSGGGNMTTDCMSTHEGGGSTSTDYELSSGNFSQAFYQYGSDWEPGSPSPSVTYYVNGSSSLCGGGSSTCTSGNVFVSTPAEYPEIDDEVGPTSVTGSITASFPQTMLVKYSRVYTKVTSGACYSTIPSPATIPHTGTC